MIGFYLVIRYVFDHTSDDFGDGLFVGVFAMAFLFWAADRAQKSRY